MTIAHGLIAVLFVLLIASALYVMSSLFMAKSPKFYGTRTKYKKKPQRRSSRLTKCW